MLYSLNSFLSILLNLLILIKFMELNSHFTLNVFLSILCLVNCSTAFNLNCAKHTVTLHSKVTKEMERNI